MLMITRQLHGVHVSVQKYKMFNDGTKLKFVNNPNSPNEIRENVSPKCEEYFRKKFSIISHGTPGIKNIKGNNSGAEFCEKTKPTLI